MRHQTQFLPSRTFPSLPGSIGLGPSLSFQLSSCYHPRPLTPRFPCEGTCRSVFSMLHASAATLLTKPHTNPPPAPIPSSPLQSHQVILYTSCPKPSHPCTSTPSTTYSSNFLESRPSTSRNAIAFTFFLSPFPQASFPTLLSSRKNSFFFVASPQRLAFCLQTYISYPAFHPSSSFFPVTTSQQKSVHLSSALSYLMPPHILQRHCSW